MAKLGRVKVAGIPRGFTERSYKIDDVTLNYVVGPDSGPPLLLIPGQMESWQGYKRVLPELSTRFHIFVPDLRGHGKSTWTPGRYSYNICGNDLKQFIRQVIQKPAYVAGLSSGGVLAIWLAANTLRMSWLSLRRIRLSSPPSGRASGMRSSWPITSKWLSIPLAAPSKNAMLNVTSPK